MLLCSRSFQIIHTSTGHCNHQHVELRDVRVQKDQEDCEKLLQWLQKHSPLINNSNLVSLSSGIIATDDINCHRAKFVGEKCITDAVKDGSLFKSLKVRRANRVKPISSLSNTIKINGNDVQVDSTLLFQRIICTVHSSLELKTCFSFELASVPLSLFDEKGLMRKTNKAALYQIINTVPERDHIFENSEYVIDGGYLLRRVIWPKKGHLILFTTLTLVT